MVFRPLSYSDLQSLYETILVMNSKKLGHINPLIMSALTNVAGGKFTHLVIGALDDQGKEAGIRPAKKGDHGALALRLSKSGGTAEFSMALLVKTYPGLAVAEGHVRVYNVSIPTEAGADHLVLNLVDSKVIIPDANKKTRKKNAGQQAASGTTAPAAGAGPQQEQSQEQQSPGKDVAASDQTEA